MSDTLDPGQSHLPIVLLVEDDPDDAFFLKRAVAKAGLRVKLAHVVDGHQAIEFLKNGRSSGTDLPAVVLLDLKLPKVSGFEVLEWVRNREWSEAICVVILTSSNQPEDLERARQLGVQWYLDKSPACENVLALLRRLLDETKMTSR